jgi:magnesium-transporting ATPase (P-type)
MTRSDAADVVPADCVILRGGAVVNEATLTGESVPQMKEALVSLKRPLDESPWLQFTSECQRF